jgi:transposase
MIDADKRKAIFLMHLEGMTASEIACHLGVSRSTVEIIIEQKGEMPDKTRKDKIQLDFDLLKKLYAECDGWMQRVHEKLVEEEGVEVKYSTLTRMLRDLGISHSAKARCDRVADEPGAEMQQDTSSYRLIIASQKVQLTACSLYMRYSKRRYLKFYRKFNRFKMKCFFHEALMHWEYAAGVCVIDNTSLARLRGTGKNAVMTPEMAAFSEKYQFKFLCHEVGHSDRKAGEERSFFTVETNFFPGRSFESLEDLNRQAFEWATVRMENRPMAKTGLIPAVAFEHERAYLRKLSSHLPPPYLIHERLTDQYGYIAFDGNYYWVPGTDREKVRVIEYSDRLKLYLNRQCAAEYLLPADGTTNQRLSPEGMPPPRHQPNNRKRPTEEEEKRLRAMSQSVNDYLDFALKCEGGIRRHYFVRRLFSLSRRMTSSLFIQSIERALHYRIVSIETIERIAALQMTQDGLMMPYAEVDEDFHKRDSYLEGSLADEPDFSVYDKILDDDSEDNNG